MSCDNILLIFTIESFCFYIYNYLFKQVFFLIKKTLIGTTNTCIEAVKKTLERNRKFF